MNRLIIVGNGFDMAHKLPTSYRSFIDYIWTNLGNGIREGDLLFKELVHMDRGFDLFSEPISNFNDFISISNIFCETYGHKMIFSQNKVSFNIKIRDRIKNHSEDIFYFKNKFFEIITVENFQNWVDIENCYYQILLKIVKGDNSIKENITGIEQLNHEFDEIKALLKKYIHEEINLKYDFSSEGLSSTEIIELIKYQYKENNDGYFNEFPNSLRESLESFNNKFHPTRFVKNRTAPIAFENLFLDFNYTKNIENYVYKLNSSNDFALGNSIHIQIHGNLESSNNEMNFGFGDEMDSNYKILENTSDNRFLDNIKSFMYFNNSNYRKLLNWIEVNDFQVYIFGHSCGLSDRTLLNTIFEHQKCKSIKIFYHKKNDETDNFKELSQNISRHFNKKSLLRDKLVNKDLSIPLPQTVFYKKNIDLTLFNY